MEGKSYIFCFFLSQKLYMLIFKKIKQYRSEWHRLNPLCQAGLQQKAHLSYFSFNHLDPIQCLLPPRFPLIWSRTLGLLRQKYQACCLQTGQCHQWRADLLFGWFSHAAATRDCCESGGLLPLLTDNPSKVTRTSVPFPSSVHIHPTSTWPNVTIQAGKKDSSRGYDSIEKFLIWGPQTPSISLQLVFL